MSVRAVRITAATIAVVAAVGMWSAGAFGGGQAASSSSASANVGAVVVNTRLAFGGSAAGTGIVVSSSGEVLTNNHVIRGATAIRVTDVSAGRTYTATVAGYSVSKDIALLRLRNAHGLQTATLGNSSSVRVGANVTAIGNAGGTGVLSTKTGTVTRLGRSITVSEEDGGSSRLSGLIETTAPLRPGDSGGPLLSNGRVIGIDAAATTDFRFASTRGQGFAIPINTALGILGRIEAGKRSSTVHVGPTAFLGVSLVQSAGYGQDVRGAVVESVVTGSPADRAGLGPADRITSLGGHRVSSPARLRSVVLRLAPGRSLRLTWVDPYTGSESTIVRLVSGPPQ
jgi:S1-C subfamily serine protease